MDIIFIPLLNSSRSKTIFAINNDIAIETESVIINMHFLISLGSLVKYLINALIKIKEILDIYNSSI